LTCNFRRDVGILTGIAAIKGKLIPDPEFHSCTIIEHLFGFLI
jgi:hypothetical protein